MALAMHTGIAPSVWADEDTQTIATALTILSDQHERK